MTTTTHGQLLDHPETWEEVRRYACFGLRAAVASRGPTRVELLLVDEVHETLLAVTPSRGQLRAQDRRRLHRLRLRQVAPDVWLARTPRRWVSASGGVLERLAASRADWSARGDLVLHVLRDGLRVDLSSVVLLLDDDALEDEA